MILRIRLSELLFCVYMVALTSFSTIASDDSAFLFGSLGAAVGMLVMALGVRENSR